MRRRFVLAVCLSIAWLFTTSVAGANENVQVIEDKTAISLAGKSATVSLSLESGYSNTVSARVTIDILNPDEAKFDSVTQSIEIPRGASVATIVFPKQRIEKSFDADLALWARLRYSIIRVEPGKSDVNLSSGIIAFSQIISNVYGIEMSAPSKVLRDRKFQAAVRAYHPITGAPIKDVELSGTVKYDHDPDDVEIKAIGRTGEDGFAVLDFGTLSKLGDADDIDLTVDAIRGIQASSLSETIDIDKTQNAFLTTDKPIYQPGQTMHVRLLAFDRLRRAIPNGSFSLKILDENSKVEFQKDLTTSNFGVASADWTIPESAARGFYEIQVGDEDHHLVSSKVMITRYDLPEFTVETKSDKPFYLPGHNADISISARYLFGQPVRHARVRVVHEIERSWNSAKQHYDVQEQEPLLGEFTDSDTFVAHLDLSASFNDLKEADYSRFSDVTYTAYITDPTTNRTEQRRFDLRLTKDPIHVYVTDPTYGHNTRLSQDFYVTTSYADGTPAVCDLTISSVPETEASSNGRRSERRTLAQIKTNSYGIAKIVVDPRLLSIDRYRNATISIAATDQEMRSGEHTEDLQIDEREQVRLETDKSIYQKGDAVRLRVIGSMQAMNLFLGVESDGQPAAFQAITIRNGEAKIELPYKPTYRGMVRISVLGQLGEDDESRVSASRAVIFPKTSDLNVHLNLDSEEYRPGQNAHAQLRVTGSDKEAMRGVFGIGIVDRAVEARNESDKFNNDSIGTDDIWKGLTGRSVCFQNVCLSDIYNLDRGKTFSPDLDLAAELLLIGQRSDLSPQLIADKTTTDPLVVFGGLIQHSLATAELSLWMNYILEGKYPSEEQTLSRMLASDRIDVTSLLDPWGTPYRPKFDAENVNSITEFESAGADKKFGTPDDFIALKIARPYFYSESVKLRPLLTDYHNRTGKFIRDEETFITEARLVGVDMDRLRDPWGQPYQIRFGVDGRYYQVILESSGPNRKFEVVGDYRPNDSDDFAVWTGTSDFIDDMESLLRKTITDQRSAGGTIPQNLEELQKTLHDRGVEANTFHDGWGHPVSFAVLVEQKFADHIEIKDTQEFGSDRSTQKTIITPVTQTVSTVIILGTRESSEHVNEQFKLGSVSFVLSERTAGDPRPSKVIKSPSIRNGSFGAIVGTVIDPNGAVIPGANVSAINEINGDTFTAKTDDEGFFVIGNLPPGLYTFKALAPGFKNNESDHVPVKSTTITQLNITLSVGATSETVSITGEASSVLNTDTAMVSTRNEFSATNKLKNNPIVFQSLSTPRLRNYFPETLAWAPSIETDKSGRAKFDFKFADNITTWRMSVIGTTVDGRVGYVEKDIRSFQPFFVDHNPPRILTEGDEIHLPVPVRNYTNVLQAVDLTLRPEAWFAINGPSTKKVSVRSNDTTTETFAIKAVSSINDGNQRVTATGKGDANDAIEKPVTVHPDGRERVVTATQLMRNAASITVDVDSAAIAGGRHAELKIYPNLLSHVSEGIKGMLVRPHGCAEQTISSTYPSLIALRYLAENSDDAKLRYKAEDFLQQGYERLMGFQSPQGGFAYWGQSGEPDLSLTAYALRFLADAAPFVEVDDKVVDAARNWIVQQQKSDGTWSAPRYYGQDTVRARDTLITAYITRTLAMAMQKSASESGANSNESVSPDAGRTTTKNALNRALEALGRRSNEIDEPYVIALYALAAFEAGENSKGSTAVARLRSLAHKEGEGMYWSLETNTPFYGWGTAGRVETTALAVQALVRDRETNKDPEQVQADRSLADTGFLFILKSKDEYGVWYSTQTTVNVYDAIIAENTKDKTDDVTSTEDVAEVVINGRRAASLPLPSSARFVSPIIFDATGFLSNGRNQIEIRRKSDASIASAQFVANYYVQWGRDKETKSQLQSNSEGLELSVNFDKTDAAVSQDITCHVKAERIGFRGYGMMLAEIGLPPGADVDRSTLDRAVKDSGWDLTKYDVLPDKLIVYIWPDAGGTSFDFKFRPRFGMKAKNSASLLYDYYNPDARVDIAPVEFRIADKANY